MLTLDRLIAIISEMESQAIFTAQQAQKLSTAATAILQDFSGTDEYLAKYQFFLALLGGKWL